jgi:hypothetical protein
MHLASQTGIEYIKKQTQSSLPCMLLKTVFLKVKRKTAFESTLTKGWKACWFSSMLDTGSTYLPGASLEKNNLKWVNLEKVKIYV